MRGFVAPTDQSWFDFLSGQDDLDEVNFWKPSGRGFAAIVPGEPFFFKLKSPFNAIGGFGIFTRAETLPIWLAWESFGRANGVISQAALVDRIRANRINDENVSTASRLGCRLLSEPVFFPQDAWVAVPHDWSGPIMSGKRYDLSIGDGMRIWAECLERAASLPRRPPWVEPAVAAARFGKPVLVRPRLGQGGFRLAVFDAYERACCVTGEHSLPVLEAAHIRPYGEGGEHRVSNGLPLRRDIHRLFDLGYVTVRPDCTFHVSQRLRVEYDNGRTYYELDGSSLRPPRQPDQRPDPEDLTWHYEHRFRAS